MFLRRSVQAVRRPLLAAPTRALSYEDAVSYCMSRGYSREVADGIAAALVESGMPRSSLLSAVKGLAGRPEVGEDAGLEDLAAAVEEQIAARSGRARVLVRVLPVGAYGEDGQPAAAPHRAFDVYGLEGMTLTDVAKSVTARQRDQNMVLGELLECACSGIMACSTCHVMIGEEWADKVGPPDEEEQDMLDLAYAPTDRSRLGCQIVLSKDLDGLEIRIPRGANNLMDDIPFE